MPFGSSSKLEPEREISDNFDFIASTESPESSSNPPSTAFNSSCVIVGFDDEVVVVPAYASHLPLQSSTKLA